MQNWFAIPHALVQTTRIGRPARPTAVDRVSESRAPRWEGSRSEPVPMTPYLAEQSFDPETLEAMGRAFAMVCDSLGLAPRSDPMTRMVAARIIEAAATGECDADRLHQAVLTWA